MTNIQLTPAQKKIETQASAMYVKVQNYYTATVRNLTSFINFLNENRDTLCEIKVTNEGEVSAEFKAAVESIIDEVNNPQPNEKIVRDVEVQYCDEENSLKFFKMDLVVRKDGKIKLLGDCFGGEWRFCFQKVRSTSKGQFVTLYKSRVYFRFAAPKF